MRRRSSLPNLVVEPDLEGNKAAKTNKKEPVKASPKSESPLIARLKKIGKRGSKESNSSTEKEGIVVCEKFYN